MQICSSLRYGNESVTPILNTYHNATSNLTYENSMEQRLSWEADSRAARQEILRLL
jgi:hypothetical protein